MHIEKSSVQIMMDAFKSDAKDKQDRIERLKSQETILGQENLTLKCELYDAELKIEELEADVKRLEKLLNMDDDTRDIVSEMYKTTLLQDPWLPDIEDTVHKAAIDRMDDKPLSCEEQMKQTDALRDADINHIHRSSQILIVDDPWEEFLKKFECDVFGVLPSTKEIFDALPLDIGIELKLERVLSIDGNYINVILESIEYGGSWNTYSNHIETMDDLKKIYNSFKEIYG